MKRLPSKFVFAILVIPILAGAQNTKSGVPRGQRQTTQQQTTAPATMAGQSTAPMATGSSLRILAPKVDAKITGSSVTTSYELINDAISASASPNFRLQLDSRDPVETTSTSHSFTGLTPGPHVLTIDVVDANDTPILGAHAEVHFTVVDQPPASGNTTVPKPQAALVPPSTRKASLPLPNDSDSDGLPSAATELPLLSMVGFGVLVGGVVSALRTRR